VEAAAIKLNKNDYIDSLFTKEFAVVREDEVLVIEL
jgi:hypothetical protein